MADEALPNVLTDEWQRTIDEGSFGVCGTRVGALAGAAQVGITVYELDPTIAYMLPTEPAARLFRGRAGVGPSPSASSGRSDAPPGR